MGTETMTIENCPPLMTVVELAKVLRVGKNTAYSLLSKHIIPSVKIGRQLRIYRDDVIVFLQDSKSKSISLKTEQKAHQIQIYPKTAEGSRH